MAGPHPLEAEAAEAFADLGGWQGAERRRVRRLAGLTAWPEETRAAFRRITDTDRMLYGAPPGPDDPDDEPDDEPAAPQPLANGHAPAAPTLTLRFAGPDRASCTVEMSPDITAAQVYGAAWFLDTLAHEVRAGQLMASAQAGIVIPRPGQPLDLSARRRSQ